jgi:hypothetical protein
MKTKLARVFDELLCEVAANPDLRARIEHHLSPSRDDGERPQPASKPRNRRSPPTIDPYAELNQSEMVLRQKLRLLSIDQLKDIVSGYALDASRLALKWKDQTRLIDFIVTSVRGRAEKGDGFRNEPERSV